MAEKEIYHLDIVIGVKGNEDTKEKLSAMDKYIAQLEKRAKAMDKITMSPAVRINDKATKQIEKVNSTLNKLNKVAATPTVKINDKASEQLEKVNGTMNRLNKAKATVMTAITDKISGPAGKIRTGLDKLNNTGVLIKTNIIDRISGPTKTILSGLGKIKNTAWSATVTIKDKVSSGLSVIRSGLSRTISMATSLQGVLLGVGGTWAGIIKPMQIAGNYEQTQMAFTTMLKSAQKANSFLSQAQDMANNTPFEFPQLADASKKMLAFGWDAKNILPDLTTIGNTASGLGLGAEGINQITLALGQMKAKGRVQGDEMLQLTEAGIPATKILQEQLGLTADQVANIGNQGLSADKAIKALLTGMDKRFGGMMQNQAKTALGLMSTLKDTFENKLLNPWGQGLWSGIKPGLSKVTDWLDKNDKKVTELGSLFKKAGENVSSFIGGGLEKAQQRLSKLMDSSQWKNASLGGKITLAWDQVIAEPFSSWWNGSGRPKINKVAGDIGSAIGGTIGGGIVSFLDALGGKEDKVGGSGTSAGTAFTNAFLQAFDTGKIVDKLISSFTGANINAAKNPNASTLTKAGLMDYILLGTLGGAKAVKGGAKAAKWFFGKGEGASKAASAGKEATGAAEEVAKGASNTSRATRFFTTAGNITKRVPLVGTVASLAGAGATVAMSSNKKRSVADVTGGLAGGVTGAKAGAAIGGTIGSIFGPAGTAVGAGVGSVAGGIAGSIGGEKALDWVYTKTGPAVQYLKTGFGDAKKSVQNSWNGLGTWFNTNVSTPVSSGFNNAEKSIESKWSNTKTWFNNKVGTPFKNGAVTAINVGVGAFSLGKDKAQKAWSPYGNWLNTNVFQPVKNKASNTGQWMGNKIGQGKSWAQGHWSGFTNWWSTNISVPTQNAASSAGQWIGTKLGQGKSWAQIQWANFSSWWGNSVATPVKGYASSAGLWIAQKYDEAKQGASNAWSSFSGWWSSNVSSPVENATSTVGSWIVQKFSEAKSSVQGVWSDFSSWWSTNISGPFNSFIQTAENKGQQITGWKIPKKANGGFTTGPELSVIGEAGTEAVIPLSSSRRNRGLQLWQQAGRMLGVRMFADGGVVGSGTTPSGKQKTTANLSTTITLGNNDSLSKFKDYGKKINNYLGNGIIAEKKVPDDSMNKVTDSSKGILDLFSKTGHIYGIGIDNDIAAGINSTISNVTSVVKILTDKVIEQFKTGFGIHSPSRVFYKLSQFIPQGVIKGMSSVDVKSFINKWMSDITSSAGGAIGGNVSGWISSALAITGSPMSWLPKLLDIASRESGNPGQLGTGNPSLMNSGPGSASGLMQCMPSTFAEFALPGLGGIFNPIANAVAAIRYIKSRYGTPFNIYTGPGYQGYANGTDNAKKGLARINEKGWEFVDFSGGENVLTHTKSVGLMERAANSINRVKSAISSLTGTATEGKSVPENISPTYYTSQPQAAMAGASYGDINVDVDNNFGNDVDVEDIVRQATAKFATELRKTLQNTKR